MALVLRDRVKETTTTTGTGTITLAGAVTGFQSFSVVGDANTTYYCIAHQTANEWEVGIGTYTSTGTTLSRTTVLESSNAGSLVTFSAGTKDVFVTYPAERSIYADGTTLQTTNSAVLPIASGGSGATTAQLAINAFAGAVTSGSYLRGNGTNVVMSTIQAADVPTLNQNTTGSAATLTTIRTLWGQNFNGSANVTGAMSSVTTLSMSGQLTNTVAIGTAPMVITSTTRVSNLNVATAGTADTLTTARNINLVSFNGSADVTIPRVRSIDDRAIAPADVSTSYATFAFGSWANNNTSPYADTWVMRSYADATGGNDNMVMFRKDALGMRVWQQAWGSATAFATYKDVAWTDGTNASGTWGIAISGNAATATSATSATSATTATNIAGGAANQIPYNTGSGATSFITAPTTSSTYLSWNGTAFAWAAAGGGATISDDTSTAATYYPSFLTATSGTLATIKVSSTKLTFNPSTGALTSTSLVSSSDERHKTNWRPLAPDFISQLAQVKHGVYDRTDAPVTQVGVSAQSLAGVLKHAVIADKDGMLSVEYGNAALVACIELAKEVVELREALRKCNKL